MDDRGRGNVLDTLFGVTKPIIGMIHVLPRPGSPRGRNCDLEHAYDRALEEALNLERADVNGLLLENAGDIPFLKPD